MSRMASPQPAIHFSLRRQPIVEFRTLAKATALGDKVGGFLDHAMPLFVVETDGVRAHGPSIGRA